MTKKDLDQIKNKEFIDGYVQLIDLFGQQINKDTWHGTFLATKDRFHSPFFQTYLTLKTTRKLISPYSNFYSFLSRFLKVFIKWFYYLFKAFFNILLCKLILIGKKKEIKKAYQNKKPYILKSFSYNHSFSNKKYIDPFFGKLSDFLNDQGCSSLTVVDPLNSPIKSFSKFKEINSATPFFLYSSLTDPIVILVKVLTSVFISISEKIFVDSIDITSVLKRQYWIDIFNPISVQGMLLEHAIKRILSDIDSEKVIMTYENINWEPYFIKGVRDSNSKPKVYGFQHAVVPLTCTNYFQAPKSHITNLLPDKIITNGEATQSILIKYGNFKNTPIVPGPALRQEYLMNLQPLPRSLDKTLLITLEGNAQTTECANYVLNSLEELKNWKIIIRTHPILPFNKLKRYLILDIEEHSNISLSTNKSLIEDFKLSTAIIYWGTTVSLEALAMGIPAIHYNRGDLISYDPVFQLDSLKFNVKKEDKLAETLENITSMSEQEFESQRKQAKDYINRYFYPINNENLSQFL